MYVVDVFPAAWDPAPLRLLEAGESVRAGFPSPAQDYFFGDLDLNELLVRDKAATFIVRVAGDSMTGVIDDEDRVIVDRSIEPKHGHIVVAVLDGELTVKRLLVTRRGVVLAAENPAYPSITVPALSELTVWGVVTWVLHRAG